MKKLALIRGLVILLALLAAAILPMWVTTAGSPWRLAQRTRRLTSGDVHSCI